MRLTKKKLFLSLALVGYCTLGAVSLAEAAMSQQWNQDAAGLGDAEAGSAAGALDASTEFYNPAGLLRIKEQQVVFGNNLYAPTDEFEGETRYANNVALTQDGSGAVFYQQLFLHYAAPISDKWAFGFGISSPFSMNTQWSEGSSAAGNTTTATLSTYDVSTDLAYAITSKLSVGAGLDFIRVIFSDYNNEVQGTTNYNTSLSGSQWDKAWHGGFLYQFTPMLRAGLAYHSKVNYEASGSAESVDADGAVLQSTSDFVLTSTLPAYTTASVYYELNPTWALEGSVNYTQWSEADEVSYQNLPTATGTIPMSIQTYDLRNTWRTALGVHYNLSTAVMLRAGAGYETSPYTDQNTVYLGAPVAGSYEASLGLHYRYSTTLAFDVGWTHLFYLEQNVNTTNVTSNSTTSGQFSGSNDILGAQVRWDML